MIISRGFYCVGFIKHKSTLHYYHKNTPMECFFCLNVFIMEEENEAYRYHNMTQAQTACSLKQPLD